MPRKRATRGQTTRAKPTLAASGDDDIVNGMTKAQREAKVESIIRDFKLNVEAMKKEYLEELNRMKKAVDTHFAQMRLKMSPRELKMAVSEYVEYLDAQTSKDEMPLQPKTDNIGAAAVYGKTDIMSALSKYRTRLPIETIPEEGAAVTTTQKKTRKRGPNKAAAGVTFSAQLPNRSVSALPPSSFETPAHMPFSMSMWGATPVVTPKFDPRLPITPADQRRPMRNEIAMSLGGSPLNMDKKTIVLHDGEEIEIEVPQKSSINTLMTMLNNIMEKTEASNSS